MRSPSSASRPGRTAAGEELRLAGRAAMISMRSRIARQNANSQLLRRAASTNAHPADRLPGQARVHSILTAIGKLEVSSEFGSLCASLVPANIHTRFRHVAGLMSKRRQARRSQPVARAKTASCAFAAKLAMREYLTYKSRRSRPRSVQPAACPLNISLASGLVRGHGSRSGLRQHNSRWPSWRVFRSMTQNPLAGAETIGEERNGYVRRPRG